MKLILRSDLRCPQRGCTAAIVEFRDTASADYRCKVHGPIRPGVKSHVGTKPTPPTLTYPVADLCRHTTPPPTEEPPPYRTTPEEQP